MKDVTGDALETIDKALGITPGQSASGTVEFEDKLLQQTFAVNEPVRRGRTLGSTTGLFSAFMRNVHSADSVVTTTVDPYVIGATAAIAPYPAAINEMQFDIWLLGAHVEQVSGSGTLAAILRYIPNAAGAAWGISDSGTAVSGVASFVVGFWDTLVTIGGLVFGIQEQGGPTAFPGLRIRRGATLSFTSDSSDLATFQVNLLLGTFPVSLGQDVKV